ncbi:MAG: hypothetical protein R3A13_11440, partial [Bdellovibrionota bacterium]
MKPSSALKQVIKHAVKQNNKRQREQNKKDKENEISNNQVAVEKFNNAVHDLVSLHSKCSEEIDWKSISQAKLIKPERDKTLENTVHNKLLNYQPNKLLKFIGIDKITRLHLKKKLERAKKKDKENHRQAMKEYQAEAEYLKRVQPIAIKITSGEASSYIEAIEIYGEFKNIPYICNNITFKILNKETILAELTSIGEDKIPTESAKVLKSGKISTKKLTKTK